MSHRFHQISFRSKTVWIVLTCILSSLLVTGACAAYEYYTGYLGDVIDLHGYSYAGGDQVYLFMTGPGLPANGVTLTDVSQRADQGQFTIVPLDSSQHWSMKWDTSRIWNEIDPGTYLVYVTTEPVDKSHLGGSNTYQTLSVYLKDAGSIAVADKSSYSLNLGDDLPVTTKTTMPVNTTTVSTSVPATEPATPAPVVSTSTIPVTTTHTAAQPVPAFVAVLGATGVCLYLVTRR